MNIREEEEEHKKDRQRLTDIMRKHSVDLIVVGANNLDARKIKEVFADVASKLKNYRQNVD
jgi:hypothetical protein